jgi:ATP-binding cassette subfamily B (MDR/TAP) protein 1
LGEASLSEGFGGDLTKAYMAIQAVRDIFQTAAFFSEEKRVGPLVQELDSQTRRAFIRGQLSGLGYGLCQFHVFSSPMNL